jgi:hypothetical protein
MNGNAIMVKFLCEQGANVELVDNESHSLIHLITGRFFSNLEKIGNFGCYFSLWTFASF